MNNRFLIFVALSFAFACCTQINQTGKVVGIADGDTFTMLDNNNRQVRVRLYGIDAPEKNQDYGQVSRKFLSDLVFNEKVTIKEIETDRYGRTIAIVTLDSIVVNEALLKAGLAWHYGRYDNNPLWVVLELDAQSKKKGLWAAKDPVAPWDFRKNERKYSKREKI
jgi:micrococcal nuclease